MTFLIIIINKKHTNSQQKTQTEQQNSLGKEQTEGNNYNYKDPIITKMICGNAITFVNST